MVSCPHLRWLADPITDKDGMVIERCANPKCNATRKAFGSWEAIVKAGHVKSSIGNSRRLLSNDKILEGIDIDVIDEIELVSVERGNGNITSSIKRRNAGNLRKPSVKQG